MHRFNKILITTLLSVTIMLNLPVRTWANKPHKAKVTYRADKLKGSEKEDGQEPYKELTGDVVFKHEDFTIYADSAQYADKKGLVKATGHLRLVDREGGVMVAEEALYDVNTQIAQLLRAVSYQRDTVSFYTEELTYSVENKIGYFKKGAKMLQGQDQLTSETGCYDQKNNLATFSGHVILLNKDYHLFCDNLSYHTDTHLATFQGPTTIVRQDKDKATITTQIGGQYNTDTQYALFQEAAVEAEKYSLYGHLIEANPEKKQYKITGQARFTSKEHNTTITGAYTYYEADKGLAEIYGDPLLERIADNDTLYLLADTLRVVEDKQDKPDTEKNNLILAYPNVKVYNKNLQGVADSMAYHSINSTIYFYNKPIFWSYDTQLTADEVNLVLNKEDVEKMNMAPEAFIVTEDTLGNYNQIKGREMVAIFKENKIDHIDITGNGETLYFALDGMELSGMNYIKCSHMRLDMDQEEKGGLAKISFFIQPTGIFYPKQKIIDTNRQLDNFGWYITKRPSLELFLARKPP